MTLDASLHSSRRSDWPIRAIVSVLIQTPAFVFMTFTGPEFLPPMFLVVLTSYGLTLSFFGGYRFRYVSSIRLVYSALFAIILLVAVFVGSPIHDFGFFPSGLIVIEAGFGWAGLTILSALADADLVGEAVDAIRRRVRAKR